MNNKILPSIQDKVNYVLGYIADFRLELEYSNKRITVYKTDNKNKRWR